MSNGTGGRIFLCHASEDKAAVATLYATLSRAGLRPWLDAKDIPPARDWDRQIRDMLQASSVVVICMSRSMVMKSGYVQRELEMALQLGTQPAATLQLIVVRLDDCDIPLAYRAIVAIDLMHADGASRLVDATKAEQGIYTDPRDGQLYRTMTLGGTTWLAQNLNYEVRGSCWYEDQPTRARPFGRLYTWSAAQLACPPGWHVPDEAEWEQLATSLSTSWDVTDGRLFNELIEGGPTGFDAVLGGMYLASPPWPGCYELHQNGYYWGGTASNGTAYRFSFGGKMGGCCGRLDAGELDDGISCRYVRNRG
jgi:uncharacterized protein (TIGR02145 family)